MFGLFKKKSAKQDVNSETELEYQEPAQHAPVQGPMPSALAWDTAIAQIHGEFSQVMADALASSAPIIDATQTDFSALERHWAPSQKELEKAQGAVDRTWRSSQRAILREHEEDEAQMFQANKVDFANLELEIAHQAAFREARARASQVMLNFALHSDARSRCCTGCGQAITSILIDRAQNIACPACQAPQTVEPGMAFRVFASVGSTWVGEWDGFASWANMLRLELQIQKFRKTKDVPMELLENYNNVSYQYWSVAFGSEAQLVPAMASHMQNKIEARMKDTRKLLRSHWQWREREEQEGTS